MAGRCRGGRLTAPRQHPAGVRRHLVAAVLLAEAVCTTLIQPPSHLPATDTATFSSAAVAPRRVVGLGDSVMAGTACGCPGIVADYTDRLGAATRRNVTGVKNLGVPGDTTADLLRRLRSDRQFSAAVVAANVVIVTVGANDLLPQQQQQEAGGCPVQCFDPAAQVMGSRLAAALDEIRALRPRPPATLLVTTYWNVFTDGAVARAVGGQPQLE